MSVALKSERRVLSVNCRAVLAWVRCCERRVRWLHILDLGCEEEGSLVKNTQSSHVGVLAPVMESTTRGQLMCVFVARYWVAKLGPYRYMYQK